MQNRPIVAVALLTLLALAGCAQPSSSPISSTPPPPPTRGEGFTAPAAPLGNATALLADLQEFTLNYGERHDNVPTHEGARQWLAKTMSSYGLQVWRQNFTTGGLAQANIVGIHWGTLRDEIVVVGGHYDTTHWDCIDGSMPCAGHKSSHGAYDDGSGTLLTVHMAKAFANVSTFDTIAFVLFDGEERGLEGANAFAEAVIDGNSPFGNATMRADIDMDMWGITWPGTNAPTQVIHNSDRLFALFETARKVKGMPDDMVSVGETSILSGGSDYATFMGQAVPTIYFASDFGQFAAPGPTTHLPGYGVYPFWHLQDTYASMLVAAGGPFALHDGFQTALDLGIAVLHRVVDDPALDLSDAT